SPATSRPLVLAGGLRAGLGAAAGPGPSPRPAYSSHDPAASASAEELIGAIGLEPRQAGSRRQRELLQHLAAVRIDSHQMALVTLPGAVPELAVDPSDPGDIAPTVDGAQNRPDPGIDLLDPPVAILPHPQRPLRPREPRVGAAPGRRDRGEHAAGLRVDFLNAIFGNLKQVLAVKGGPGMRGHIDRAHGIPARRIEDGEPVPGREPDVPAIEGDPVDPVDTRERSILAEDFGRRSKHA